MRGGSSSQLGRFLSFSATGLVCQFVLQCLAGFYLNRAYIPKPELAHGTMESIMGASPHAIVSGFHYWGGALFLAHSLIHLTCMVLGGAFRPPTLWPWFSALAFVACAYLLQITGNLLPFDRHGVQTAAIEGGIAASMPGGKAIAALVMGGEPYFNERTLMAWYFAHRLLIPAALLLGAIACVSTCFGRGAAWLRWIGGLGVALIPLVLAYAVQRPLGTAATAYDFNRFGASVGWYAWPLHGSLNFFGRLDPSLGWVGSAVMPALFGLLLVAAPSLSKRLATSGIQFLYLLFVGYFVLCGALFAGSPAPLVGTRDPIERETALSPVSGSSIDEPLAARGREAFNSAPCAGCHGVDGGRSSGGPKLDRIGAVHSDAAWYIEFIRDPQSKKPGTTMPSFPNLRDTDVRAIAEYLRSKR